MQFLFYRLRQFCVRVKLIPQVDADASITQVVFTWLAHLIAREP